MPKFIRRGNAEKAEELYARMNRPGIAATKAM
jgi:hypothetical protein